MRLPIAELRAAEDPWMAAMRRGDFDTAWALSDAVLARRLRRGERCWHWPRHLQYVWRGAPLEDRRVLVRCYHGLGDTLQFVRFAEPLRARAREVTLWVQPALLPLVSTVRGVDRCLPLHDGAPEAEFDVDIELMELPHALRVCWASLPRRIPYVHPPLASEPLENDGRLRVGIAWQSGDWNPQRSLPLASLSGLRELRSVRVFSLQYGAGQAAVETLGACDLSCADIACMAARMQALDLVISVDTMVAHLAGAMGIATWTLLHHDCDWRWMSDRSDSPWYPGMRLFRQRRAGEWGSVVDEVMAALMTLRRTRADS